MTAPRLTVIEPNLTPCPYKRLWLVQIPEDGWDRFECIVDDSTLRSPGSARVQIPKNGVEFVRKGSAPYTADQLQAAYDRAYADVRREYAEDLPALLGSVGCQSVEELVARHQQASASHAETARATRSALVRLWMPTASVVAIVERAADLGCLDEESQAWLRRMQAERRREEARQEAK